MIKNQVRVKINRGRLMEELESTSKFLRQTKVRVLGNQECRGMDIFQNILFNEESMLCAYAPHTDSCQVQSEFLNKSLIIKLHNLQGDSGGPLFHEYQPNQYEIIGVVSFGLGCARSTGVYAKVSSPVTLNWIHNVIELSNSEVCADPRKRIG